MRLPLIAAWLFISALLFAQTPATPTNDQGSTDPFVQPRRLMQTGKYDEAIAELQELLQRVPRTKGVSRELGIAYYRKNDYGKAIESFKQAVAEDAADNEAVQLLGISYYLSGRPALAIPLLEKVQSWFPSANVDASYMLGICYLQTEAPDKARRAFAVMYGVPADSAASYLFTARMMLRQQFDPIAEEYAKKAATLDPKLPGSHYLLGELYMAKGDIPSAVREFESELKINPAEASAYYKLGDAYSRIQKFDEAERVLQRSIWLDSTSTGPYILMGKVLAKKGESELAVRSLQHALSMDPNNSITHFLLGQAYRDLGKREEAAAEFKLAEQLKNSGDQR
jgi:tetratricopeptide (TPR) repeat protein